MSSPDPAGDYEESVCNLLDEVNPFRKRRRVRFLTFHRNRLALVQAEIAAALQLDDDDREKVAGIIRERL